MRDLAKHEHDACGGLGVGAVGMCLTGGFALAMSVDDAVVAPVIGQAGPPMPFGATRKAAFGVADADLQRVKRRAGEGLCLMGLRFSGDKAAPAERYETLRRGLGESFIGVEIDSSPGNPWVTRNRLIRSSPRTTGTPWDRPPVRL